MCRTIFVCFIAKNSVPDITNLGLVVVVYFQTDIYIYNIPKCYYIQLIICIYSLRLHQKARPVMVAQP